MTVVDAAMPAERVLEVEGLKVNFRIDPRTELEAVKGVSFHIDKGETLALVGESGSGKSVTAMTLIRLTEYDGARIAGGTVRLRLLDGKVEDLTAVSLTRMTEIRGADISIVFQDPMSSLNPVFPVGEQIAEAVIRTRARPRTKRRRSR